MKIGIIAASGKAGHFILKETLNRGHEVTAIVRDQSKLENENVPVIEKNILNITQNDVKGFDVVINAFGAPLGEEQIHVDAGHALIEAIKETEIRAVIVGGCGGLFADDSKTTLLVDTPNVPESIKPTSRGQVRNLKELQETDNIKWTFISPPLIFDPEGKKQDSIQ